MINKIIVLFIVLFISTTAYAEEAIKVTIEKNENLSLNNCIEFALQNNPEIRSKIYQATAQKSKIGQVKSSYLPQIDVSSGYKVNDTDTTKTDDNMSADVSLSQLIWDFGRTSNSVKTEKINYDASKEEVSNIISNIIYSVKESYFTVLYKMQTIEVIEDSVQMYKKQLQQTSSYYEKGFKSKIDVTAAEYNLSNSKLNRIKAKNELKIALATLNKTMGMSDFADYTLTDKLKFDDYNIELNEALNIATENRPDFKKANFNIKSAQRNLKANKSEYFPSLKAFSGYGVGGSFPLAGNWSVGANLSIPVFNGLLTKNKVNEAKAQLMSKQEDSKTVKQIIILEVNENYYNLMESKEKLPVSELMVKQGKEKYDLAQKRYTVGIGDIIELKDAEVEYRKAKLEYVKTIYDYNVALAALKKSIGINIPEFKENI